MPQPDYTIRQNDAGDLISAVLVDSAGAAVDLTDATVVFQLAPIGGGSLVVDAGADLGDDTGAVSYTWQAADTETAGWFLASWQVTFEGGAVQTYPLTAYTLVQIIGELGLIPEADSPPNRSAQSFAVIAAGIVAQDATGFVAAAETVLPVDAVNLLYGSWKAPATLPPIVYPAGPVVGITGLTVDRVDTRVVGYEVSFRLFVTNEDESEYVVLVGFVIAGNSVEHDSASLDLSTVTVVDSAGADLSYDTDTGNVVSAAGGTYAAVARFEGGWDA